MCGVGAQPITRSPGLLQHNGVGKEAILAILDADEILGEDCLSQTARTATARALVDSRLVSVTTETAQKLLGENVGFADFLIGHLLKGGRRMEEQLIDRLFNSSERRLARALLTLANYATTGEPTWVTIPRLSQETLAEMVGSTRPRISEFMNKFRRLGYVDYNGSTITVHRLLLSALLQERKDHGNERSKMDLCR